MKQVLWTLVVFLIQLTQVSSLPGACCSKSAEVPLWPTSDDNGSKRYRAWSPTFTKHEPRVVTKMPVDATRQPALLRDNPGLLVSVKDSLLTPEYIAARNKVRDQDSLKSHASLATQDSIQTQASSATMHSFKSLGSLASHPSLTSQSSVASDNSHSGSGRPMVAVKQRFRHVGANGGHAGNWDHLKEEWEGSLPHFGEHGEIRDVTSASRSPEWPAVPRRSESDSRIHFQQAHEEEEDYASPSRSHSRTQSDGVVQEWHHSFTPSFPPIRPSKSVERGSDNFELVTPHRPRHSLTESDLGHYH